MLYLFSSLLLVYNSITLPFLTLSPLQRIGQAVMVIKSKHTLGQTKHYSYHANLWLDNTFYVITLIDIMSLPKPPKMSFQIGTSKFYLSLTVLGSLSGQQSQQILPRYQSCYLIYLDIFDLYSNLYLSGNGHTYDES